MMGRSIRTIGILFVTPILSFFLVGCSMTSTYAKTGGGVSLLISNQKELESVPVPKYTVKIKKIQNESQESSTLEQNDPNNPEDCLEEYENLNFDVPWYVAVGGQIKNETGAFERAPAGQTDQSTMLGLGTRKYVLQALYDTPAVRVLYRDPMDWPFIKQCIQDYTQSLTPLTKEMANRCIFHRLKPMEFFVTATLMEINIGEESYAEGVTFAGIGPSRKVVWTSITASLEITDPYAGEVVVAVTGRIVVKAYKVGFNTFKIVSIGGVEDKYLNIEMGAAKELIKDRAQAELFNFLVKEAFIRLYKEKSEYLEKRLLFEAGMIKTTAESLAAERGCELAGEPQPIFE